MVDRNGNRLTPAHALGRWFAASLSYLTLYIGFLMAAFTDRKQALHDMVAGTTGEVIVIPRTWSVAWIKRAAVYGHVASEWEIEHQAGPNWRASFVVAEER